MSHCSAVENALGSRFSLHIRLRRCPASLAFFKRFVVASNPVLVVFALREEEVNRKGRAEIEIELVKGCFVLKRCNDTDTINSACL